MKKIATLLFGLLLFNTINSQTIVGDYLDINNIKALFNSDGSLFYNNTTGKFEVPKGSGAKTIFAAGLWMGGYDAGGTLKLAGQTYNQIGNDFFPGPLNSVGSTDSSTMFYFNRVWKINKCTIDSFIVHCATGLPANYVTPNVITTWPAANTLNTFPNQPLAPFFDFDNDGVYNPANCDYPLIKGDQAIFFVFNDAGKIHTETGAPAMGVEIQAMAYAYNCMNDSALYNTIFTNYIIRNKSSFRLDSTFIGNWADYDIGAYVDDFVGCDVTRSAMYAYNADLIDGPSGSGEIAYGANPPAQATVFLAGPFKDADGLDNPANVTPNGSNYGDNIIDNERLGLTNFISYLNSADPIRGNPNGAPNFYSYMTSTWRNLQPLTYGGNGITGGTSANFMFPGNTDPLGFGTGMVPQSPWDEITAGNTPSDRRGLGAIGPFTLQPGAVHQLDFAYVYGRATSGGNLASAAVMLNRVDNIKQKFNAGITPCGCSSANGINSLSNVNTFSFYPNPALSELTVRYNGSSKTYSIKVFDATGKLVKQMGSISTDKSTFSVSDLNSGLYLLNVYDGENSVTKRFVKQ